MGETYAAARPRTAHRENWRMSPGTLLSHTGVSLSTRCGCARATDRGHAADDVSELVGEKPVRNEAPVILLCGLSDAHCHCSDDCHGD